VKYKVGKVLSRKGRNKVGGGGGGVGGKFGEKGQSRTNLQEDLHARELPLKEIEGKYTRMH